MGGGGLISLEGEEYQGPSAFKGRIQLRDFRFSGIHFVRIQIQWRMHAHTQFSYRVLALILYICRAFINICSCLCFFTLSSERKSSYP